MFAQKVQTESMKESKENSDYEEEERDSHSKLENKGICGELSTNFKYILTDLRKRQR